MSIFWLMTGIGETNCQQLPDGVLIQTPQGAGRVQMTINGVRMRFGSLVYLTTAQQHLILRRGGYGQCWHRHTTGQHRQCRFNPHDRTHWHAQFAMPCQDIETLFGINFDNLSSFGNSNIFNARLDEFKNVNWDDMHQNIISTFAPNGAMDGVYFSP
jgi:hypothetical protein